MDSDISNRSSDGLRNVVIGRVTEDGSWTKVGKFGDEVKTVTFHGEPMPEEFKTRHLHIWDEVTLTAEITGTTAKQITDKIYKELITSFLSQMAEQFSKIEEAYICYANPDDRDAVESCVEFIKSLYGTTPLRTLNDVIYTKLIEKGRILLAPVSSIYGNLPSCLYGTQEDTIIIDEMATEVQQEPPVRDISWIRKQMKHCKNPMERKRLEKELNAAFREKKRRRKNE